MKNVKKEVVTLFRRLMRGISKAKAEQLLLSHIENNHLHISF